jgi:hypothetical protein
MISKCYADAVDDQFQQICSGRALPSQSVRQLVESEWRSLSDRNVASKGVNFWKGRFRTVHLRLIAARDENRVTKRRELFGEFVTDAAATAGDQNRIAREFHN